MLDTFEMTDIPQMLRLNCFGDNFISRAPILVTFTLLLLGIICTQTDHFFRLKLTVLLPYLRKLVIWE